MKRLQTLFLLLSFLVASPLWARQVVCPQVVLVDAPEMKFSENEKTLLCGSEKVEAWSRVPLNQSQYHMKVFLEKRGYFEPDFRVREGALEVQVGPQSKARQLLFRDMPDIFPEDRKRGVEGETLNPGLLNDLEGWTESQLRAIGFPCPEASVVADPETGKIIVTSEPGPFQDLIAVEREDVEDIHEEVLKRYDAFVLGQVYNADLLRLTSDRLVRDGIVQSAHFTTECTPEGAVAHENLIAGKPRVVVIGLGASTEEFPLFRASWKSVRLGALGSSLHASTFLSSRQQEALFGGNFYIFPNTPELYLSPNIKVEREDEPSYETITTRATAHIGYTNDDWARHYEVEVGPAFNDSYVFKGAGPEHSTYLTIDGRLQVVSHYYEYYQPSPRTGYFFEINSRSRRAGLLSDVSADRLDLKGKVLYNYNNYDPPLLVAGLRFRLATTRYDRNVFEESQLPPDYRYFLGGDSSIRGFSRNEIDGYNGQGYLTVAYAGTELRLADLVYRDIEPFVFADVAWTGNRSFTIEDGYFWSPGFGFRWQTLIGVIRGTAGYGVVRDEEARQQGLESHWQYFLSYGQEF